MFVDYKYTKGHSVINAGYLSSSATTTDTPPRVQFRKKCLNIRKVSGPYANAPDPEFSQSDLSRLSHRECCLEVDELRVELDRVTRLLQAENKGRKEPNSEEQKTMLEEAERETEMKRILREVRDRGRGIVLFLSYSYSYLSALLPS